MQRTSIAPILAILLACREPPNATNACSSERATAIQARDIYRAYDSTSEPELVPLRSSPEGDRRVLIKQRRSTGGEWMDEETEILEQAATEEVGEVWQENYQTFRARAATKGDLRRYKLGKDWSNADRATDACRERVCGKLETTMHDAKRLYELHNSESTARELQQAESAWKQCQGW